MALSKEDILNVVDCEITKLKVDAWGGEVYLKKLSAKAREQWERITVNGAGKVKGYLRAHVAVLSLCDEQGNLLFDESHIEALANKNSVVLNDIFNEVMTLNAVSSDDIDKLEGNSEPTP